MIEPNDLTPAPGPWEVTTWGAVLDWQGNEVAHVFEFKNLALVAAAPDLVAALRGVLRVADRATHEFDAARDALKKAGVES